MKNPNRITVNAALERMHKQVMNVLLSRTAYMVGSSLDKPERDIPKECGYPDTEPSIYQYKEMFDTVGIGNRSVGVYPQETWSIYPELYEVEDNTKTEFEKVWEEFEFEHDPWEVLNRVDEISGIGRFGVLFIGLLDGKQPNEPVDGIDSKTGKVSANWKYVKRKVTFLRPFDESLVSVIQYDEDINSYRYGMPVMYNIKVVDPADSSEAGVAVDPTTTESVTQTYTDIDVHWTRIIHIADLRKSSEIYAMPRLRPVFNYILDLRKVGGSSAEMFWKGGFPGLSFEAFPELSAIGDLDTESLKTEIEAYSQGLQRYLRLVGMTAKSLAPQVADPTNNITSLISLICATLGVPMRIFMGSEAGHLASQQDSVSWNRRLKGRQIKYANPKIIKPFVQRLMMMGVLPTIPRFTINWTDLNSLSDTDKAKVSLQKAQAILQYVTSGSSKLISPKMFLVHILNMTTAEADAVIKAAGGESKVMKNLEKMAKATAGNTPATKKGDSSKSTGAGGRRNGLGKNQTKKNV